MSASVNLLVAGERLMVALDHKDCKALLNVLQVKININLETPHLV